MSLFESLREADLNALSGWLVSNQAKLVELGHQERLGLLEALTARIMAAADQIDEHDWIRVARAFDVALEMSADGDIPNATRTLNLMSVLFRVRGPRFDIPLLNPDHGAEIFFRASELEIPDARRLALRWSEQSLDDIRRLRNIKNMVTPLVSFVDQLSDPQTKARVYEWGALLPQLP
jgi:hypothetical protein